MSLTAALHISANTAVNDTSSLVGITAYLTLHDRGEVDREHSERLIGERRAPGSKRAYAKAFYM